MDKGAWLLIRHAVSGDAAHRLRDGSQTLGRSQGCDIHIEHSSVSRVHARIVRDHGALSIRDLGSSNGTFVHDARVTESPLHIGSTVRLGSVIFDVVDDAEAAAFLAANDDETTGQDDSEAGRSVRAGHLSPAEARVLRLLMMGLAEKEVADRLYLSPHTVHNHVKEIYRILNVHSRPELLARYGRSGNPDAMVNPNE